jgi:hypothetical protein
MSRWFRHYAGMMRDEKLVRVAVKSRQPIERVIWVYGAMLESACEVQDGGRFDIDADEIAYFLRCEAEDITAIVGGLEASGRTEGDTIPRWADRQFESDASRERVRKHREKKAKRPCNADETLQPVTVTLQETETETDTEREETLANANDAADAPPLSPVDEVWVHCVPELVALSGKAESTVRKWIGKGLSKHSPVALRDAIRAAVAAKTGDPFAYVTRVLIPDPQARGSPGRADCASAADELVKRLSDDTFAQPVARPMLTAVRG